MGVNFTMLYIVEYCESFDTPNNNIVAIAFAYYCIVFILATLCTCIVMLNSLQQI